MDDLELEMRKRTRFTVDLTPGPAEIENIVRMVQSFHKSSDLKDRVKAFGILEAGWPSMKIGQAVRLLNGEIDIWQALEIEKPCPTDLT